MPRRERFYREAIVGKLLQVIKNASGWAVFALFVLLLRLIFGSQIPPAANPAAPGTPSLTPPRPDLTVLPSPATPSVIPSASPIAVLPTLTPVLNPTLPPVVWRAEQIKVTGERPIDPTGNAIFLGWSPDGSKFLFRKSQVDYVLVRQNTPGGGWRGDVGDLWEMDTEGTNRRRLAGDVGSWA